MQGQEVEFWQEEDIWVIQCKIWMLIMITLLMVEVGGLVARVLCVWKTGRLGVAM